jgi:hypothetical protein
MTAVPVAFKSNEGKYRFIGTTKLVNAYAEQMGADAKGALAALPTGGIVEFSDTDAGPCRGMIYMPDLEKAYTVHNSSVYRHTSDGTAFRIGTIPGVDQVELSRNQKADPEITVRAPAGPQIIASDSVSYVTDDDLPDDVVSQCNAVNRTIYAYADRTYFYSGINDSGTTGSLDFSTFDSQAGKLLRVYSDRGELFGFCNSWTDIHAKTGSADEPFIFQTTIPRGILAGMSLVKHGNSLAWVGDDSNIHQLGASYGTSVISTPEISRLISDDTAQGDIVGFSFDQEGHSFGVWSGTNWTKVRDDATKVWHDRKSYGYDRWRAIHSIAAFGKVLVGDRLSGKIGYIDKDTFTEYGETMVWQVVSPPMHAFPGGFVLHALHLDMATGFGSLGTTPLVMIETSRDGGQTFTQYREVSLGTPGDYQARVTTRRLGAYYEKGCVIRVSVSDPSARALVGIDAEVGPLKR